jgi:hypothetical protein
MNIGENCKVFQTVPAQDLSGAVNGAVLDTAGWDELLVIVNAGLATGAGTLNVKVQEDTLVAFSSPSDISGAAFTEIVAANDNTSYIGRIKLDGDRQQFMRAVATQAVASVLGSVTFVLVKHHHSNKAVAPAFNV